MHKKHLVELQSTIENAIPMCAQMGIHVHSYDERGLTMRAPLSRNFNLLKTAFAGSLYSLCTITAWGSVFLLLREHDLSGDVVLRRSTIKFRKPIDSPEIFAFCPHAPEAHQTHFIEMLTEKGQAKIDLQVEIPEFGDGAVFFRGSYVVL